MGIAAAFSAGRQAGLGATTSIMRAKQEREEMEMIRRLREATLRNMEQQQRLAQRQESRLERQFNQTGAREDRRLALDEQRTASLTALQEGQLGLAEGQLGLAQAADARASASHGLSMEAAEQDLISARFRHTQLEKDAAEAEKLRSATTDLKLLQLKAEETRLKHDQKWQSVTGSFADQMLEAIETPPPPPVDLPFQSASDVINARLGFSPSIGLLQGAEDVSGQRARSEARLRSLGIDLGSSDPANVTPTYDPVAARAERIARAEHAEEMARLGHANPIEQFFAAAGAYGPGYLSRNLAPDEPKAGLLSGFRIPMRRIATDDLLTGANSIAAANARRLSFAEFGPGRSPFTDAVLPDEQVPMADRLEQLKALGLLDMTDRQIDLLRLSEAGIIE